MDNIRIEFKTENRPKGFIRIPFASAGSEVIIDAIGDSVIIIFNTPELNIQEILAIMELFVSGYREGSRWAWERFQNGEEEE